LNSALRVDVQLQLGAQKKALTVKASALHVETASAQIGEVISGGKMCALPLNGRSYTDLLALQPGVAPASTLLPSSVVMTAVNTSIVPSGDLNPGNLSISGQREFANGFILNGSDADERVNMGTAIIPNLDSIAEFRILTSNFDAPYGNYAGGEIIVATRSGTHQPHGDGFEFLRNTALDARNFFAPSRAKFDPNQFGGSLGGPLRRVFFFADYPRTRMSEGVDTGLIPVPSLADRTGNLADQAGALTGAVNGQYWASLLSQVLHYPVSPGEPYYTPTCSTPGQCVFPGAQIPFSAWSAPAHHLLQYIPLPNTPGNFFSTSAFDETLRDDKGSLRLDATTRWGMLSTYYFLDDYFLNNSYPVNRTGANVPGFNALSFGRAQLINLGDTQTLRSSGVNEFCFSFMRDANVVGQPVGGVGPTLASQGFVTGPGTLDIVPLDPKIEGVENIVFNNYTLGINTTGMSQFDNAFEALDNFTKIMCTHTVKAGGKFYFVQVNDIPDFIYNGSFQFFGTATGVDFADFLLGAPSDFGQGDGQSIYERNPYATAYLQDTWRVFLR
jgi:hypothetical protein